MIDVRDIKTRYSEIEKNIRDRYMNVDLKKIAEDILKLKITKIRSRCNSIDYLNPHIDLIDEVAQCSLVLCYVLIHRW